MQKFNDMKNISRNENGASPESLTNRTHAKHKMKVGPHSVNEEIENALDIVLDALLLDGVGHGGS